MKVFDFDWQPFFQRLRTWSEITTPSRLAYVTLPSGSPTPMESFGKDLDRLLREQWLAMYADGRRVRIHDEARWMASTLRAMHRHSSQLDTESDMRVYLHSHFTHPEQNALASGDFSGRGSLPARAASEEWLNGFLSESAVQWVGRRLQNSGERPSPETISAAQSLVREATSWRQPVPLHELPARLASVPPEQVWPAIRLAVRVLLLFPRLRDDDLVVEIGLWPALVERLHRPKPSPPSVVEPGERFQLAYLVEDMTMLLIAAADETPRVRGHDYHLFSKAEERICEQLVTLPAWLEAWISKRHHQRLIEAQALLRDMRLIDYAGRAGRDLRITPTAAAHQWLADTDEGRIRRVVRQLSPAERHPKCGYHFDPGDPRTAKLALPRRAVRAFGDTVVGQFLVWDEFLRWHTEMSNPLLEKVRQEGAESLRYVFWWVSRTTEELERLWGLILRGYLLEYLLPLAGVEVAVAEGDRISFRLTDGGRYILGLASDFSYRPEKSAGGEIVVQPNFEIVFLSPSPLAEATLARFAERLPSAARGGRGIGALFKITRAAIYSAAASGATADHVLATLRDISAKPLPANVQREIEGWFGQCRSVELKHAVLIRCPDADTAARVVSASGRKAQLLTDTIVELQNPKDQPALVKKLRVAGIFIQPPGKPI